MSGERTFYRVTLADGEVVSRERVEMEDIKPGEHFQIDTDDPTDHVYAEKDRVYRCTQGVTVVLGEPAIECEPIS